MKEDIVGNRYGKLIVLSKTDRKTKDGHYYYNCQCDCGNTKEIIAKSLKRGLTKSCGCVRKETMSTHGLSQSRFYAIWEGMIDRVTNPENDRYTRYGGRGITICKEWNDFSNFKNDMYDSYCMHVKEFGENDTTIDRINTDGNYEFDNCRWATNKQQANNRSTNVMIEWNGKTQSMKMWSEELNISYDTIRSRYKRGWSVERIMTTPQQIKRKKEDR